MLCLKTLSNALCSKAKQLRVVLRPDFLEIHLLLVSYYGHTIIVSIVFQASTVKKLTRRNLGKNHEKNNGTRKCNAKYSATEISISKTLYKMVSKFGFKILPTFNKFSFQEVHVHYPATCP